MRMSKDYEEMWPEGNPHEICRILILAHLFSVSLCVRYTSYAEGKLVSSRALEFNQLDLLASFCDLPLRFLGLDDYSDDWNIHRFPGVKMSVSVSRAKHIDGDSLDLETDTEKSHHWVRFECEIEVRLKIWKWWILISWRCRRTLISIEFRWQCCRNFCWTDWTNPPHALSLTWLKIVSGLSCQFD